MVRDRLRWPVDPSYLSTVFKVRDVVEVWCTGTHVKGAWLQARVRQVRVGCWQLLTEDAGGVLGGVNGRRACKDSSSACAPVACWWVYGRFVPSKFLTDAGDDWEGRSYVQGGRSC